jgi:hypothetical protein
MFGPCIAAMVEARACLAFVHAVFENAGTFYKYPDSVTLRAGAF